MNENYLKYNGIVETNKFNLKVDDLFQKESIDINTGELRKVIVWALDLDEWKHSWHNEISNKNYDKFLNIITDKIEKRAEEIQNLIAIYNRINSEK